MSEAKKSYSEQQLEQLNKTLEAQSKAKQERMQYKLAQQFKRINIKRLEELNKDNL